MNHKILLREIADMAGLSRIYRHFRSVAYRICGLRHPIQDLNTAHCYRLLRVGSETCGWMIVDDPALYGSVVVSAGLGEDASFDTELVSKYDLTVHIVDPTPRAIAHFEALSECFGQARTSPYIFSGSQPVTAYDLVNVSDRQLILHKLALWNKSGIVRFFLPKDTKNVSHSIVNFQNAYSDRTPFIEVEAVTLSSLIDSIGASSRQFSLLKLDIKGAEIEVLEEFLTSDSMLPRQILVEFDELNIPSKRGLSRVDRVYNLLTDCGYRLIHTDSQADFLFVQGSVDFTQEHKIDSE